MTSSQIQVQDGGRPVIRKSLYRHISVKNNSIVMKFRTVNQIVNVMKMI